MPLRVNITVILSVLVMQLAMAQQMFPPSPFDGEAGLKSFIARELVYPRKALLDSTEGMVNLLFVVDKDGSIQELNVWQSLTAETDAEAIRVFKKVQWHPARMGSINMASEHYMRVEFDLRKYRRAVMNRGYDILPAIIVPIDLSEKIWRQEDIDTVAWPVVPAEFSDLTTYLSSKVNYPDNAFSLSMEGRVELEFVVEQHGGVNNVRAVEWMGGGCYEEAERLCRSIRWIPAIKNGRSVRSFSRITLDFELPKDPKLDH